MREDQAQRPYDVRRRAQQDLALLQRLADPPELVLFEIAQPAVDQLARCRGGVVGEVVLLAQHHLKATPGGVTGDAGAVDPTSDEEEVDDGARPR